MHWKVHHIHDIKRLPPSHHQHTEVNRKKTKPATANDFNFIRIFSYKGNDAQIVAYIEFLKKVPHNNHF